jgi:hypothetical protein
MRTTTIKFLMLILLVALTITTKAQKKLKHYLIAGSSCLVSGMLDGTVESISYHYDNGFKPRFKHINDQFWNPALSWKNKYKNGDPTQGPQFAGSTTMFCYTTDAYHLLRTTKRTLDGFTLVYFMDQSCKNKVNAEMTSFEKRQFKKKKWKNAVKDFAILTTIRCIGFHLTYSVAFKPQTYHK